jgi:putative ABC transport system permease protein
MAPLGLRLAIRELRAGVRGFRILLACLALGVAAIAAAGSMAQAFRAGLAAEGREILGGDLAVTVGERPFTPGERAAMERLGRVDYAVAAQAMAQAASGERRLVDLRGVSDGYPLVGKVELAGRLGLAQALAPLHGAQGVAVERSLLDRLGLRLGDRFLVGNTPMVARAVLVAEPDRLSRGWALGPRVLARLSAVEGGGFLGPGLPFGETARIALPPGAPLAPARAALKRALRLGLQGGGLRLRDRAHAAPGLHRLLDQLDYFLGLIGLAALIAGGLGVAGAVTAFLETRTSDIAVLKALGAPAALARDAYGIQIGALATLGVAGGLVVGAAAPLLLGALVKDQLPVPALFAVYPWPLAKAAAFGLLAAAAFSLIPLARARVTSPSALFRRDLERRPSFGPETLAALAAAVALAALAIAAAPAPLVAGVAIGALAAAFAVLWSLGIGAALAAGRLRGAARGSVRIALANLAGPRSAARTATPAIGLGVALLCAVVLIQSSLLAEVNEVAPRTAPALVFTGVPPGQGIAFDAALAGAFRRPLTGRDYLRAPFVTGRIVAVRGQAADRLRIGEADRWAYDRDIDLSVLARQPPNAGIVAGAWWPARYAGPPLVALSTDAAKGAHLKLGDRITLAVLGRRVEAKVAVLRKVDVAAFGANFPVILDPAALAGAGLGDIAIARASRAEEGRATLALGAAFPRVNVISVREALEAASDLFARLALAIRAAAAVVALAGLLVLAGGIAAGTQARAREAAILKVLGADRRQVLTLYAIEYGAVGLVAGAAGVALGCAAAWPVVVLVFEASWSVDWTGVAALVGGAAALAGLAGLAAALRALNGRPAAVLRSQ